MNLSRGWSRADHKDVRSLEPKELSSSLEDKLLCDGPASRKILRRARTTEGERERERGGGGGGEGERGREGGREREADEQQCRLVLMQTEAQYMLYLPLFSTQH